MKLDKGYKLCKLGRSNIVAPVEIKNVDLTRVLSLNITAAEIWNKMSEGDFTVQSLVDHITAEFDVSPEVAQTDIETIIARLKRYSIITD